MMAGNISWHSEKLGGRTIPVDNWRCQQVLGILVDRTNITLLKLLLVDVALESLEAEQI
jgi:hypothetical protein